MSATVTDFARRHRVYETQDSVAPGVDLAPDQTIADAQAASVGGTTCADQCAHETHVRPVGAQLDRDHVRSESHSQTVAVELLFAAAFHSDVERVRIATENRLRAMRDETGGAIDLRVYEQQIEAFARIEHQAELQLKRTLRSHPLGPWVKATIGVGEKQGARLIAAIGDPAWNTLEDRPRRGPAELWAYCGYAPGQRRQRGQRANWNAEAKMRAWLIAESCVKQAGAGGAMTESSPNDRARRPSPYRAVYDRARAKHAEAVHDAPCARCGPSGKPAQPDSPLSDGHKHARALREVAKAVLRDLFLEAKRLSLDPGHTSSVTHTSLAPVTTSAPTKLLPTSKPHASAPSIFKGEK